MSLKKLAFFVLLALFSAIAICYWSEPMLYADKLIQIQAEQKLGAVNRGILDQPPDVQAMLLDYLGDGEFDPKTAAGQLVIKAWIALEKYPTSAREILQLYGSQPEFQAVLREYGENVIPVIKFFVVNHLYSLTAMNTAGKTVATVKQTAADLWNKVTGSAPPPTVQPARPPVKTEYGPMERGWYAIHSIQSGGHRFLAQFELDKENTAHWNQTDRAVSAVGSFFTGGVSNLEKKYELDEAISGRDVFFAAVDIIPFVAAVKLLKVGKVVAATGKELSLVSKTRVFGARLIPRSRFLKSLGGVGAKLAVVYVLVNHPGLINSILGEIANILGVNPMIFQIACWFTLISIALYPLSWILKILAKSVYTGILWLEKSRKGRPSAVTPGTRSVAFV
jgi:hypothetical protein